ncbi:unnamed protein product [Eretmochelys imbricata]
MARGQQKIQSQQKNAKKQAGQKKKQGHDQKAAAKAALIYTCTVCRSEFMAPIDSSTVRPYITNLQLLF